MICVTVFSASFPMANAPSVVSNSCLRRWFKDALHNSSLRVMQSILNTGHWMARHDTMVRGTAIVG